jgi:circadian clock protein KaiC
VEEEYDDEKAASAVPGLDDILGGGFTRGGLFLLEGEPGTGKTTLATQFLLEGVRLGERCLYVTLSETRSELLRGARSHGWMLRPDIDIHEAQPASYINDPSQQQTLLYASELELGEVVRDIFAACQKSNPARIVIDSLSELRLLAQSSLRYRHQLLGMKHEFAKMSATVLALDDLTADADDKSAHSIAHGVLRLEQRAPNFGGQRRCLRVHKYRGQAFRGGYHDFTIKRGGLFVFPRLVAAEHRTDFVPSIVSSGNAHLDALLGGGLESGSSTLILGPAGAGKSLIVFQFLAAACKRGERAALFVFDEELGLLFRRSKAMGIDLEAMQASGALRVEQLDAAELSPGEFSHRVRDAVDQGGARTVVFDSLNGYQQSMPEEHALILHMHELLQYLNRQGASSFLTVAQHGLIGDMKAPVDVTYLADTVILLRFFEAEARVRRAISVIKKRTGRHEDTIREMTITSNGMTLSDPLLGFHGVLRGVPELTRRATPASRDDVSS